MDKLSTRKALVQSRLDMPDRLARADLLQRVMRIWLVGSPHEVIGAYWPIKGEFDPLPALYRWQEDATLGGVTGSNDDDVEEIPAQLATESMANRSPRKIGLPVVNKLHKTLVFHAWYPGCPMEEDAYGIPKPKDTEVIVPSLLFVPCVGYGPGGYRLGYGGGFYDRTLATLQPRPVTVGLGYAQGWLPDMEPEPHDIALDVILNDRGVVWPV
jgi:5-formyltetrahydrofolate cyclo-ligase